MSRRPLAISLGDPAGIGPEIAVKTWAALRHEAAPFMVVGDFVQLAAVAGGRDIVRVGNAAEAVRAFPSALPVYDLPLTTPVTAGQADARHAPAILAWIETAVDLTLKGEVAGVVTAPIAKAPLYEAGFRFPGHTEFLAELTKAAPYEGVRGPVMMLAGGNLRVCLATIHMPLREVAGALSIDRIVHVGQVTAEALRRDFGLAAPRLAMAGLNPHAGESGGLGREEIDILAPAADALRALGVDCSDPLPADTMFHTEARQRYDAALCMYHDQGLIPLKMLDFWSGVNVTLGLPLVRTSPDHGVGYDIASKGLARPDSMVAAVRLAAEIAGRREKAGA